VPCLTYGSRSDSPNTHCWLRSSTYGDNPEARTGLTSANIECLDNYVMQTPGWQQADDYKATGTDASGNNVFTVDHTLTVTSAFTLKLTTTGSASDDDQVWIQFNTVSSESNSELWGLVRWRFRDWAVELYPCVEAYSFYSTDVPAPYRMTNVPSSPQKEWELIWETDDFIIKCNGDEVWRFVYANAQDDLTVCAEDHFHDGSTIKKFWFREDQDPDTATDRFCVPSVTNSCPSPFSNPTAVVVNNGCEMQEFDFFEDDINQSGEPRVENLQQCILNCQDDTDCKSITFANAGSDEGKCWLKNSAFGASPQGKPERISVSMDCL